MAWRVIARIAVVGALAATVGSCSDIATAIPSLPGVYDLTTLNGAKLPGLMPDDASSATRMRMTKANIAFEIDQTLSLFVEYEEFDKATGATVSTSSETFAGSFQAFDNLATIKISGDPDIVAEWDGTTVTYSKLVAAGVTYKFAYTKR